MENLDIGNGARKLFEIRLFGGVIDITVTTTWISLAVVTVALMLLAFFATRKLTVRPGRFQVIVEKLVSMLYSLVEETMGKHNLKYAPYIGTLYNGVYSKKPIAAQKNKSRGGFLCEKIFFSPLATTCRG